MNKGIFAMACFGQNIEEFSLGSVSLSSRTSLKNQRADFSVPPCGTQVLAKIDNMPNRKRFIPSPRTYLSFAWASLREERDRFQLAANQREGSGGLGVNTFQAKSKIKNQKSNVYHPGTRYH